MKTMRLPAGRRVPARKPAHEVAERILDTCARLNADWFPMYGVDVLADELTRDLPIFAQENREEIVVALVKRLVALQTAMQETRRIKSVLPLEDDEP